MAGLNLDKLKPLLAKLKRKPVDVLGLDAGHSGIKAVRMRLVDKQPTVVAVDILPAIPIPVAGAEGYPDIQPLVLPKNLVAKYAALVVPGRGAVVKLLTFPAAAAGAADVETKIVEGLGIEKPEEYRIGYKMLKEVSPKSESRSLVAALPEVEASYAAKLLPSGTPAPYSLEIAGLASMTAFLSGPAQAHAEEAVGMIEFGANVSYFAIVNKTVPVLLRKFDFGSSLILEMVQQSLGIDQATAEGILTDGSFDISQQISDVLENFIKQVVVSRDFVERREGCRITRVFASGGVTRSRDWTQEVKSAVGHEVEQWNPFDCVKVADGAIPEHLKGQEARFAAAVGAGLGVIVQEAQ